MVPLEFTCRCVCVFHRTDERRDTDRSGTLIQKQRFIGINVALISFSVSEIWKLKSKLFCYQIRTTLLVIIGLLKNQFEEKDSFPERSKHIFGNLQMLWFHLPGENQKLWNWIKNNHALQIPAGKVLINIHNGILATFGKNWVMSEESCFTTNAVLRREVKKKFISCQRLKSQKHLVSIGLSCSGFS